MVLIGNVSGHDFPVPLNEFWWFYVTYPPDKEPIESVWVELEGPIKLVTTSSTVYTLWLEPTLGLTSAHLSSCCLSMACNHFANFDL